MAMAGGPMDWTISFGTSHSDGMAFTDTYTFTYSGVPGTAQGFFANVASVGGDLNFSAANLNGAMLPITNMGAFSGSLFFMTPASGTLVLTIMGTDKGTASYAGTLDVSTPVPEPATYGMLLGGLTLLAAAARRRKS